VNEAGAQILNPFASDLQIGQVFLLGQIGVVGEDAFFHYESEMKSYVLVFFDPMTRRCDKAEFEFTTFVNSLPICVVKENLDLFCRSFLNTSLPSLSDTFIVIILKFIHGPRRHHSPLLDDP